MANTLDNSEKSERRAAPRVSTIEYAAVANGRLRAGRAANIVDVSRGGALIETDCRLFPGMRVELQLGEPVTLYRVKGRVLRCHVWLLGRERIRYRGALAFDEELPLSGNERPVGSLCTRDDDLPA